jgi:DNA polymerase III subunit delta
VADWKPAYLIHGDDHGRIAERRARLRAMAEAETGSAGVEVLEGEACTGENVAAALSAMTFALGRRFVIAEGVERWKDADVEQVAPILASLPPDTTVAFFAREEGRAKVPAALRKAVEKAGGAIAEEGTAKAWELPKWVAEQARRAGLEVDKGAASALVRRVGERQQRLLREVERLALELGPGATLTAEDVEELAAGSAEHKAWSLADALVARDQAAAVNRFLELRRQGERLPTLLYHMTGRLRDAHRVVSRLDAGEAPAEVRKELRMPPRAAGEFLAQAQRSDASHLRAAIARLADLEHDTRGGGTLSEDTAALRAIAAIAR